jgi:dTDP-3-amino-2,3,6-trideoxy-4-keto-D-glucose/dTDP-3-amino-3,4,6-trideoxy-alpha-D-glucose/dTDP-2,6-dideoxy-D-kanosamine transaminase
MAMSQVPLFDARAANAGLDLDGAVGRVLKRHWYVLGDEVRRFEDAFAAYCGVRHCVSLANGTDALELALRGAGVGPGDRVLLAANAGYYGSTAVHLVGAEPAYVDVDRTSMNLSVPETARAVAQRRPKAIIATHLYGYMADVRALAEISRAHDVILIEDCAQAHGARRGGSMAGSVGDVSCFSFYPTKNLGALGDGGAIVSNDEALAARIRSLRQYGWSQKYRNDLAGGRNSRLDEMQAAILNEKLPVLDRHNQLRRDVAVHYCREFADLPLVLPASCGEDHVAHLFVVRTSRRDDLRAHLQASGVATDIHYPVPDHRQRVASPSELSLPATEDACAQVLSLPCYPGMQTAQVQQVVEAVRGFFAQTTG